MVVEDHPHKPSKIIFCRVANFDQCPLTPFGEGSPEEGGPLRIKVKATCIKLSLIRHHQIASQFNAHQCLLREGSPRRERAVERCGQGHQSKEDEDETRSKAKETRREEAIALVDGTSTTVMES